MKKIVYLLVAINSFICGCRKQSTDTTFQTNIYGSWELEKTIGFPSFILPEGNGNIIIISESGSFERRAHDTLLFKGTYTLEHKQDCYPRSNTTILTTSESTTGNYQYAEVVNGKLELSTPNCLQDGSTSVYKRVITEGK